VGHRLAHRTWSITTTPGDPVCVVGPRSRGPALRRCRGCLILSPFVHARLPALLQPDEGAEGAADGGLLAGQRRTASRQHVSHDEPRWARWLLRVARVRLNISVGAACHCQLQASLGFHFRCSIHAASPHPACCRGLNTSLSLAAPILSSPPASCGTRISRAPQARPTRVATLSCSSISRRVRADTEVQAQEQRCKCRSRGAGAGRPRAALHCALLGRTPGTLAYPHEQLDRAGAVAFAGRLRGPAARCCRAQDATAAAGARA